MKAKKILELACGTGSVLKPLSNKYKVSGLDLSKKMLAIARKKVPEVKFYHQNMVTFLINERFDVILCVFDSMNHILKFGDWEKIFTNVKNHLTDNGIFIFDINTTRKLDRHVTEPPYVKEFGKNYMIMNVTKKKGGITNWSVKIFENQGGNTFLLSEENIEEISFPFQKIKKSLQKIYSHVRVHDTSRAIPMNQSERLYFICKK